MGQSVVPVLYLDIDGTVRWGKDELGKFVNTAEDVKVFEEVPQLLAHYKANGWKIIGVSNQGGIGLGYMDNVTCAAAMAETNRQAGDVFNRILWCPHKPDEGCACRKPKAGLVFRGQRYIYETYAESVPLNIGVFVGDRPEDAECARNAGLQFVDAEYWRSGKHLAGWLWETA